MKDLINSLYENNLGKMFVSYTNDGILGSMAFFAIDNKEFIFYLVLMTQKCVVFIPAQWCFGMLSGF